MTPKKAFKFFISFFVLGVCLIYTCKFIAVNYCNKDKIAHIEDTREEAVIPSLSPSDILPSPSDLSVASQDYNLGWERIKHTYYPDLPQLQWTDMGNEYVVGVENVSYKVVDASIQKNWNPEWNFEKLVDLGAYSFKKDRSLKGKKSFVSASLVLKYLGQDDYSCCLKNISLFIFDKEGNKIRSGETWTTSQKKALSKSFFFEKLSPGEDFAVDIVYIMDDELLDDSYYYFLDVNPWDVYPTSEDQIGLFKLPLGAESESYDKE